MNAEAIIREVAFLLGLWLIFDNVELSGSLFWAFIGVTLVVLAPASLGRRP